MQVTGMLYGAQLLKHVDFPTSEVLGPDADEDEIKALIDRHKMIFIKPLFKGGIGKKGKAGLIGRATDLKTAMRERERLYFVEHQHGNTVAKANGVRFTKRALLDTCFASNAFRKERRIYTRLFVFVSVRVCVLMQHSLC